MAETNSNRTAWVIIVAALLGGVLSSWLSPKAIAWYFDPPVSMGVNCSEATKWAMGKLQWAQFVGIVVGGVIGSILVFTARRKGNRDPL